MTHTISCLGIHVMQFPSGRWGVVGSGIPVALAYVRKDGAPLTAQDITAIAQCGPGFANVKAVTWETREAAIEACRASGVTISE